jgi:AmpD protein
VRELENVLERALALMTGDQIEAVDLNLAPSPIARWRSPGRRRLVAGSSRPGGAESHPGCAGAVERQSNRCRPPAGRHFPLPALSDGKTGDQRVTPAGAEGIDAGWLPGAQRIPSPNCDERPPDEVVRLVVIHAISLPPGEFGGPGIVDLFTNRLDPEAHPYYPRDPAACACRRISLSAGTAALLQFVPCSRRAWHAGVSTWMGRSSCNDFSIGIELEGCDELAFEDAQYLALNRLLARSAAPLSDRSAGGSQRYRAGPQDRSRTAFRLASGRRRSLITVASLQRRFFASVIRKHLQLKKSTTTISARSSMTH